MHPCTIRSIVLITIISTFKAVLSETFWDCSPVYDTCPDDGVVIALGPFTAPNLTLKYPDPLQQLPSLWKSQADFSLSGWFRSQCIDGSTSCNSVSAAWLEWNTILPSFSNMLLFSYGFDPNQNQIQITIKYGLCSARATVQATLGYWTMLSMALGKATDTTFTLKVWSNRTSIFSQSMSCGFLQGNSTLSGSLGSVSSDSNSSIFNLRVYDHAISDTVVKSLYRMIPDSTNPAYVPKSNWRYYLDPKDPLRSTQNINSETGRLLAAGPIIPTYNATLGYTRGSISLSYFWLSMQLNVDNTPATTVDTCIPIFQIRTASGASVTIWWVRLAKDGTAKSSILAGIAKNTASSICPGSSDVLGLGLLSFTTSGWHSVSFTATAVIGGASTYTFTADGISATSSLSTYVFSFEEAGFFSAPIIPNASSCKTNIPIPDSFSILLSSIRFKNESTQPSVSTFSASSVSASNPTNYCNVGSNLDSVQFPPAPCSGHGNASFSQMSCSCEKARTGSGCRKCLPGAVAVASYAGDPYGTCYCPIGTGLQSSGCVNCIPGFYSSRINGDCTLCPSGTISPTFGASNCTACPAGTHSSIDQTTCLSCSKGLYSTAKSATCSPCPSGNVPSADSTYCQGCKPGTFANVTTCSSCSLGSASSMYNASACPLCDTGRFSNTAGLTQCLLCQAGKFTSRTGSTECQSCPLGTFASSPGTSSCQSCDAGTFANVTGLSQCWKCPAGTATRSPGSVTCSACQPGTFASGPGSTVCQTCGSGTVSGTGQTNCTACPAGTFAQVSQCTQCSVGTWSGPAADTCSQCPDGSISSSDRTSCIECDMGTYASRELNECITCPSGSVSQKGSTSCTACPAGTYANSTCVACPFGSYSTQGATNCTQCPAGTMPDRAQAGCTLCQAGSYSKDGTMCSPCPSGYYSDASGSVDCQLCDSGSVSGFGAQTCKQCGSGTGPSTDKSSCVSCSSGRYSNTLTNGTCDACPVGRYSLNLAEISCTVCPAGRYSNVTARSTECSTCSLVSYSDSEGANKCKPCQAHSAVSDPTSATSQEACLCDVGYFHNSTADINGFICDLCSAGFQCESTGVVEPLTVKAGYYVDVQTDKYVAYICDPADACLASTGQTTQCKQLYTGFRCSSCINGVSYRLQEECHPCGTNVVGIVLMVLAAISFCAAFLAFAKPSKAPLSAIGLCLSNVQLIAVFATSLTNNWTPEIQALWQVFSILNFNIELFRPECAVPMSFWTKQYLKLLLPIISFMILVLMSCCYFVFCRIAGTTTSIANLQNRVIFAVNLILLYGYTLLVSAAADPFNCQDAGRGQLFLKREPSVSCISDEYHINIWSSYIALSLYGIGIPLGFSMLLWYRHRKRTLFTESFSNRFGELISPYNPDFFWWEIINMIRRLLIIMTINLVQGKFAQLFLILAILFLTLLLHSFFNPYKTKEENRLATLWNLVTILVLFSAAILDSSDTTTGPNEMERKTLTIMVFVGLASTAAYTLKCLISELETRKRALLEMIDKRAKKSRLKKLANSAKSSNSDLQPTKGIRSMRGAVIATTPVSMSLAEGSLVSGKYFVASMHGTDLSTTRSIRPHGQQQ